MKKMSSYKRGGAKKMKKKLPKAQPGRQTGKAIQNFYSKADAFLDNMFPGRQARQDMRGEAKAYRQAARLARKKARTDRKMDRFYNRMNQGQPNFMGPFAPGTPVRRFPTESEGVYMPDAPGRPSPPTREQLEPTNYKRGGKYGHGGQWTRNPKGSRRCM